MNQIHTYELEVGVDIAKATFRAQIGTKQSDYKNAKSGFSSLLKDIRKCSSSFRITCESTGGYEDQLISFCLENQIPVSQCNPVHIKHFIRSHGRYAKTDTIDAGYITKYAEERTPETLEEGWLKTKERRELQLRIDFLVKENGSRKSTLDKYSNKAILAEIKRDIKVNVTKIKKHRKELKKLIDDDQQLARIRKVLETVIGVGEVTSMTLINTLPELGKVNRKEIASLVGVAPNHHDSGNMKGYRKIYGGRERPRTALYVAALVAATHNPHLKVFYQSLKNEGKKTRVALIAVARKLLVHLNSLLKKEIYGI